MNLSQQSVLPAPNERSTALTVTPVNSAEGKLGVQFKNQPSSRCSIGIFIKAGQNFSAGTQLNGRLPLYQLNARGELNLDLNITYQRPAQYPGLTVRLFAMVGSNPKELDLPVQTLSPSTLTLQIRDTKEHVTAIGIAVQGPAQVLGRITTQGSLFSLLDILAISLKSTGQNYPKDIPIQDLQVLQLGEDKTFHHRLRWSFSSITVPNGFLMPWSDVTGPFSHFEIGVEKQLLGRAYALQLIIDESLYRAWSQHKTTINVDITGYAFDGTAIGVLKGKQITLV